MLKANCIQAGVTDTDSFRMIPSSDEIKKLTIFTTTNICNQYLWQNTNLGFLK